MGDPQGERPPESGREEGETEGGDATPDLVGELLAAIGDGHDEAWDQLLPILYQELRQIARRQLMGERPDHTLRTTALVHEAYLKLVATGHPRWNDRTHFFAVASRAMRQVLTDYARSRKRAKRGGGRTPISLDHVTPIVEQRDEMFIALDESLQRLEAVNVRQCRVVECRFYSGLSIADTAAALGMSVNTVKRDWALARAWLNQELGAP